MLPHHNLFLIGMPGSGKTSLGRLLAKRLHKTFIDADAEIETRTGVSVSMIFELEGEAGFREREKKVIADLVLHDNIVLATGGGAILLEENRYLLATHGHVIYLSATVETLLKRLHAGTTRPLLHKTDMEQKLTELSRQRHEWYLATADTVIEVGMEPIQTLVQKVLVLVKLAG